MVIRIHVKQLSRSQRVLKDGTCSYSGLGVLSLKFGKLTLICQIYYPGFSPVIPVSILAEVNGLCGMSRPVRDRRNWAI